MINEELFCTEHHTKCGILCERIKAKPELNERMINYNFALICFFYFIYLCQTQQRPIITRKTKAQ